MPRPHVHLLLGALSTLTACDFGDKDPTDTSSEEPTNTAPTTPTVELSPAEPTTLDDIEVVILSASSDPDGDSVSYRVTWFQDGAVRDDVGGDTVPAALTAKGEVWRAVVTPTDGAAEGVPAEATVVVVNTPPSASLTLAPADPLHTDDLVATATFSDEDGDLVEGIWSWTVDGEDAGIDGDTVLAEHTAAGQVWQATLIPFDGEDEGEAALAEITIGNTPPTVEAVTLDPSPATVSDTLVATATTSDEDGDTLTITYRWTVDGAVVQEGEDDTLAPGMFSKGQEVIVEVTADDGWESVSLASDPLVIENTPPQITSVTLNPAEVREADTVTCVAEGWSDADGDAESLRYAWTVDGAVLAATGSTLDGASFDKGQVITCEITPDDGADLGEALTSDPVTVLNTPPVLTSATISPSSPTVADTLTATLGEATDADGDDVSTALSWTVGGAELGSNTSLELVGLARGDVVTLTATPSDDEEAGTAVTDSVTVGNAAPAVLSVTLSPTSPTTDDTISAAVVSSDADDDTVSFTYAWTVDGVAAGSGSTLDGATAFDKGDTIQLTVTPTDGLEAGEAVASASVVVVNSPPGAPTVSISPSSPTAGDDDLVCEVVADSDDADGDDVTYTVTWTVDGATWTGSTTTTTWPGDTIDGARTSTDDVWRCTVTPDDGEDTGTAATDSVTVRGDCSIVRVAMLPGWGSLSRTSWAMVDTYWSTYGDCEVQITELGHGYTASSLSSYDVVLLADAGGGDELVTSAEETALRSFSASGGGVVMTFLVYGAHEDNRHVFDLVGIDADYTSVSAMAASTTVYVLDTSHGLANDLPSSFTLGSYAYAQAVTDFTSVLLPGAEVVISSTDKANRVIAYEGDGFRGVYFTAMPEYSTTSSTYANTRLAMYNALIWAAGY